MREKEHSILDGHARILGGGLKVYLTRTMNESALLLADSQSLCHGLCAILPPLPGCGHGRQATTGT